MHIFVDTSFGSSGNKSKRLLSLLLLDKMKVVSISIAASIAMPMGNAHQNHSLLIAPAANGTAMSTMACRMLNTIDSRLNPGVDVYNKIRYKHKTYYAQVIILVLNRVDVAFSKDIEKQGGGEHH